MNGAATAGAARGDGRRVPERLGVPFVLLLVYLVMDYARPTNPMGIPLVISLVLFLSWLLLRTKRWHPQIVCFFLLIGGIALAAPFAVNTFAIYTGFRGMAVELLCICTPIAHFVSSLRKLRIFVGLWIVVFVYVALYAATHSGMGPGGHIGDENDVALALNMAIPFAFALIWSGRAKLVRLFAVGAFWLMVAAVTLTFSRGGFLGLVAVLLYCFFLIPGRRAWAAVFVGALILGSFFAPARYWDEMATIVDEAKGGSGGTGDLRREYWTVAWQMFSANPILGVGLDNFRWTVDQYAPPEVVERAGRSYAGNVAHSVYFTILAETGLVGGVLFVLLVWYTVRDTGRVLRLAQGREPPLGRSGGAAVDMTLGADLGAAWLLAHAIRGALAGYLVAGLFLSVFTYPHFWVLAALTVALLEATRARLGMGTASEEGVARPSAGAVHPQGRASDGRPEERVRRMGR